MRPSPSALFVAAAIALAPGVGFEEDKAETFAFAMAHPAQTREQAEREPVVAAKLDDIARRLGTLDPEAPRLLDPARRR